MVSIIVPCYNEQESLPYFYEAYKKETEGFCDDALGKETFELILINDGSKDNTLNVMKELSMKDNSVHYVSFSRNFGKEAAMYAGLEKSQGDYVVIMDADLQDPPYLLKEMYKYVSSGEYESVCTRRVDRKGEPPIRSFFARCFYKIANKMMNIELMDGARDYRMMSRKFVNALLRLKEHNRFSKGLFAWVGFKTKWLEFENVERIAGETKWSFWGLLLYAIEGIVAFTTTPLVLSTVIGILCCLLSVFATVFVVVRKILFGDPVQGWASMICIFLFIGGIQLFCVGILRQYLAKIYLESKNRPIYIVEEEN